MNAIQLLKPFAAGGVTETGIWQCSKCNCLNFSQRAGDACCDFYNCQYCGNKVEEMQCLTCRACRLKMEREKEETAFANAKKIPVAEYKGWVYLEGTGNNGYSASWDDLAEELANDCEPGDPEPEPPKYVWGCKPIFYCHVDGSEIIERLADASCLEDFDESFVKGFEDLQAALAAFNKANEGTCSWETDYTTAVIIG